MARANLRGVVNPASNAKMRSAAKQRARLADPTTYAAMDAAAQAGEARFGAALNAIRAEIETLLAGRNPKSLAGVEAVSLMGLLAKFNARSVEEREFTIADLWAKLHPPTGSETVDA